MKYKRSLENIDEYNQRKKNINEFFDSIEEYIIISLFASKNQSFVLCRNKFPYNHTTYHYNIWRNPRYDHLLYYDFEDIYKNVFFPNCVIFENNESDKSVKTITHYHILTNDPINYRNIYSLVF